MDNITVVVLADSQRARTGDAGSSAGRRPESPWAIRRKPLSARLRTLPLFSTGRAPARYCARFSECARQYAGCIAGRPGWTMCCSPNWSQSPVPLTNGSGVFSPPLGEFVLGRDSVFRQGFPPPDPQSSGAALGAVRRHRNQRQDRRDCGLRRYRPGGCRRGCTPWECASGAAPLGSPARPSGPRGGADFTGRRDWSRCSRSAITWW